MKKCVLILADGMRPDALRACGHPFAEEMPARSVCAMGAQTVMPSVTLPCHVSLFQSVPPTRHGVTTNTFVPNPDPVDGLFEVVRRAGRSCGLFYNWGELRDLARPSTLTHIGFLSGDRYGYEAANERVTKLSLDCLRADAPDFLFLYLGWPDAAGHKSGWMGEEYLRAVRGSWDCIEAVCRAVPEDYLVVVTADHGGHDRSHGTEMPEDMTIPILFWNASLVPHALEEASILDIAPTIAAWMEIPVPDEVPWEGRALSL